MQRNPICLPLVNCGVSYWIAFGFLVGSDALNAAQERIAHLTATDQNTTDIAALQATVAAQTTTINAQGAVIVEHQNLLDQLVTLLPPPPGNDYIELTGRRITLPFLQDSVTFWIGLKVGV